MSNYIPLRFNRFQLLAHLNFSNRNRLIGSRGIGKTTLLGWIIKNVVEDMPRSANALVARTYIQALTRTIPAVIGGLETFNYKMGRDYIIGKEPPKSWPRPYFPPVSFEHFISFRNGSGYHVVSQDREGSSRGFNLDSYIGDEGLNLIKKRLDDEVSVANRANVGRFSYSRYHLSETIVSSQPILPESKWLLDDSVYYKKNGTPYEEFRDSLTDILIALVDSETEEEMQFHWKKAYEIKMRWKYYKHYDTIPVTNQKISTFFLDGDIFDNIQNLGWKYVKQQRASMNDLNFRVEILNAIYTMSEQGFYPDLCERHLYDTKDYSILDKYGYSITSEADLDSTHDPSIEPSMPLHIACDYGGSFNCMVASQEYEDEERFVASFHEYHPNKISHVVEQYIKFFAHHKNRDVYFWYDQTAIGTNGLVDYNYADEVMSLLRKAGWNVIPQYMGAAPSHFLKYLFMGNIFSERNRPKLPMVRMHRERCKPLYNSMKLVSIKQTSKGIEKDKTPEKKQAVDQVKAPHLSDAADLLLCA
jgi:hypothetical protein